MIKNQRKIGFVLSYASIFVSSLIGILFTPYMISTLGKNEYGIYQLLYAAIGYVALLDFGLGSTLTRFILKYKAQEQGDKVDQVVTMGVKIYTVFGAIAMIAVGIISVFLDSFFPESINEQNLEYARTLFLIMGVTTAVSLLSHAFAGVQTAYEKFLVSKGIYLVRQLARVIIIIVLIKMGMGAMGVVCTDLFITLVMALFDGLYCKFVLKVRIFHGKWENELFKNLLSFSFFAFLQIIITQVNNSLDRIILGRYSGLEYVALYGVAMQLHTLFISVGGVISGITLPQISNAVFGESSKELLTDKCVVYSRYQVYVSALVVGGFILFGKQFAALWSPDFDASAVYIIVLLIALPQVLESVEGTIFNVMKAKNLQATRSLILLGVAVFNVILSILLIQHFPVYGAAIGTCVSFIVGNNILSNIYYHKKVGVHIPRFFKGLFKGIGPAWLLSLALGLVLTLIPLGGWTGFILKGGLYVVVYAVCMLGIGLNDSEKRLVRSTVGRLRRRK